HEVHYLSTYDVLWLKHIRCVLAAHVHDLMKRNSMQSPSRLRSRMHAVSYACRRNLLELVVAWYLSQVRPRSIM
ncbi:hypothetical protein TorRG33x02_334040, partial [Trema orientale]